MFVVELNSTTKEKLRAVLETSGDPTGGSVYWALAAPGSDPSFSDAGSWSGTYDAATDQVTTLSPLISGTGNGGTITVADGTWDVWVQFTVGSEVIVRRAGRLYLT